MSCAFSITKGGDGMTANVLTGADQLSELSHPFLEGKRIGLVTNPTGITADFRTTIEICAQLKSSRLTALFAGEHGLYGERQAGVPFEDEMHPVLGIPVFSLYGKQKTPTPKMLEQVDTVIFDMQDAGARFYTYLSTLFYIMDACGASGKSLLVLDRINPMGGMKVEGGILQQGYESFVGAWHMPIRYGMTIGEIALMRNKEEGSGCELDVVRLEGWRRSMTYAETGQPWMMPSPNIPSPETAEVYAGTCLFEGTNVSEGRGTTRPFEWIGAPWMDGERIARQMEVHQLPGVHIHPVYAAPVYSKHQGVLCGGVRLFITDRDQFIAVETGLMLLHEIARSYPQHFEWTPPPPGGSRYFIDLLTGGREIRERVRDEEGLRQIMANWHQDEEKWRERRASYLIYGS